ncbi:MAG: DUF1186 domain-containing protein [Candidatus Hydrogenedentota bacterium]
MEIADIVKALERNTGSFPRKAIEAAVEQPEAITPELLRVLEYTLANAEELAWEDREDVYFGHLYALHLLAQFRETRAFPLAIRFCELPGETQYELLGDVNVESILASTFDGDTDALKRVIENPECYVYARWTALDTLLVLVRMGVKQRDEVMAYVQELFREKLEHVASPVWDGVLHCAMELYPGEVWADIQQVFAEDLVDLTEADLRYIEGVLAKGKERVLEDFFSDAPGPIDDTIEEMEDWECFRETPIPAYLSPPPVAKARPASKPHKVGRNDPCPCGSGKKYEKCCG